MRPAVAIGTEMFRFLPIAALILAAACSAPEQETRSAPAKPAAPAPEIRDETHRFHKEGLVEAKVVEDKVGGKDFMPGGNHALYETDGKQYQVFFATRRSAEQAMFLAMDYKGVLSDSKFIPHFGGFFGVDGDTPTLVFQKNKYIIVVAGLDLDDADHAGRLIAGYLN